jgi:hypothetical protein
VERGQDRDGALESRGAEARSRVGDQVPVGVKPAGEALERHQVRPAGPVLLPHLLQGELPLQEPLVGDVAGIPETPAHRPRGGHEGVPARLVGTARPVRDGAIDPQLGQVPPPQDRESKRHGSSPTRPSPTLPRTVAKPPPRGKRDLGHGGCDDVGAHRRWRGTCSNQRASGSAGRSTARNSVRDQPKHAKGTSWREGEPSWDRCKAERSDAESSDLAKIPQGAAARSRRQARPSGCRARGAGVYGVGSAVLARRLLLHFAAALRWPSGSEAISAGLRTRAVHPPVDSRTYPALGPLP